MIKSQVKVINHLGLHARAAAQLVRLASQFKSKIKLKKIENSIIADAKSILSVLSLAASKGTSLEVEVVGDDETDAFKAINEIFEKGFGEL